MKSKRSVYLLLPVVLLVWGLIGWRIWSARAGAEEEPGQPSASVLAAKPVAVQARPALLASYADPFRPIPGSSPPQSASSPSPAGMVISMPVPHSAAPAANLNFPVKPATAVPAVPVVNWPVVKYLGVIAKSGGSEQVALLSIDNQESVVRIGKSARGVEVLRLFRDSVQLSFSKQKKSFLRNAN